MRRFSSTLVLCAWLLASGAHWDLVQSFAWGRMIATYSQSMPLAEAIRVTFTAGNFCGICTFVADGKTRPDADGTAPAPASCDPATKATLIFLPSTAHRFACAIVPAPAWSTADFRPVTHARAAPPTEPPRTA